MNGLWLLGRRGVEEMSSCFSGCVPLHFVPTPSIHFPCIESLSNEGVGEESSASIERGMGAILYYVVVLQWVQ